jgi:hypothetical protein
MFCAVALFGGLAHHADAQPSEDDRTAISLAGARKKYEQSMEGTRKSILNALNAALTKAPGAKDSTDAVNKARAELQAFEREGKVPATLARWEQDYAKAAKEMKDAYARAMADYAKQKAHELADAVNAEASRFAASWDLVPWRDDLFKGKSEADRTIAPDRKNLSADIGISGAYRLEVVAHRAAESNGTPTIELPLVDGRRVRVSALPDGPNVRVLLTVGTEVVSADLGVARPIDLTNAQKSGTGSHAAKAIVLSAESGPIVVDSVRVKPVVEGKPPEVVVQPPLADKAPARGQQPAAANASIPKGSVWRGTVDPRGMQGFNVAMKVTKSTPTELIMHGDWPGAGGMELTFAVSGTNLALTGVMPTGSRGGIYHDVRGSGIVNGKSMSISYDWRVDIRKDKNKNQTGTMMLNQE